MARRGHWGTERERIIDHWQRHGQRGGAPPQTQWISRTTVLGRCVKFTTLGSSFAMLRPTTIPSLSSSVAVRTCPRLTTETTRPYYNTWTYPPSADCQRLTPEPQDGDMLLGRTIGPFLTGPCSSSTVPRTALPGSPTRRSTSLRSHRCPFSSRSRRVPSAPLPSTTPTPRTWVRAGAGLDQHCENVPLGRAPVARCIRIDCRVELQHRRRAHRALSDDLHRRDLLPALLFVECPSASDRRPADAQLRRALLPPERLLDVRHGHNVAANTTVVLSWGGFLTHANMGQRHVQLNNMYSVNDDGSYVLYVSQVPPNANPLMPGLALLFVVVNGVPSNSTMVIVGTGQVGTQPTAMAVPVALPAVTTGRRRRPRRRVQHGGCLC